MAQTRNIFLIGFMGAGKSTIAKELSKELSMERLEMDEEIVRRQGKPIADIFAEEGEAYFRNLESELLVELQTGEPKVVSCGGGVVMREENIAHMKKNGTIVLLTATPETIYERVKDSTERPILNQNMSVEYIAELLEKRRTRYEAAAQIIVATDKKNVREICKEMIEKLEK